MKTTIRPGDRVRMSRKFLRNTGQYAGGDSRSVWEVLSIDGAHGWAVVNEEADPTYFTAEELSADPALAYRRIALANLERVAEVAR